MNQIYFRVVLENPLLWLKIPNLFNQLVNDKSSESSIIVIIFDFNVDNVYHFTGVPTSLTQIWVQVSVSSLSFLATHNSPTLSSHFINGSKIWSMRNSAAAVHLLSRTWSNTRSWQVKIKSNSSWFSWKRSGFSLILLFRSSMLSSPFWV